MPEVLNRIKIAKSFGLASQSYDISSRLQRYTGKHLMSLLPNRSDLTVVDLGSGTGFFTDMLIICLSKQIVLMLFILIWLFSGVIHSMILLKKFYACSNQEDCLYFPPYSMAHYMS